MGETINLIIPIAGIAAVIFALYLARDVISKDQGTQAMQEVAATIYEGAVAFIRRQYTTIGILALLGAAVIAVVIAVVEGKEVADTNIFG
ncbi:MAG: sodium/proton-translocating pyrophosphatase, partial [Candidatus Limnocylindrales bacterium]